MLSDVFAILGQQRGYSTSCPPTVARSCRCMLLYAIEKKLASNIQLYVTGNIFVIVKSLVLYSNFKVWTSNVFYYFCKLLFLPLISAVKNSSLTACVIQRCIGMGGYIRVWYYRR